MSRKREFKCRFLYVFLLWAVVVPWFFYSYFVGKNSVTYLRDLKRTEERLQREADFWKFQNEILREKLSQLKENRSFYYEKLAREMLVKGKEGEEVILFVK